MGCGCGGANQPGVWQPASRESNTDADTTALTPNEAIQQQRHEQQARRVWPAVHTGGSRAPAETR